MSTSTWHLKPEHEILGARLDDALECVIDYGDIEDEMAALAGEQAVVDLHSLRMLLVSGADAEYFMQCACATQMLFVGQNAFTAIFDSDGMLLGCPLIMRTGDHEFLLFDRGVQFENILDWLCALASAKQQGQSLFAGVEVQEQTGALYPMVLCGPGAKDILNDYLEDKNSLEYPGMTASLKLDQIDAIGSRLALEYPVYLLLVPPAMARTLFRSFLSFKELKTAGFTSYWKYLSNGECEFLKLFNTDEELNDAAEDHKFDPKKFEKRGLVRPDKNFIGARAIYS